MRYIKRQRAIEEVSGGSDQVIAAAVLPEGGKCNQIHMEIGVLANTPQSIFTDSFWAIKGYLIPIVDPENSTTYDVLWDTYVPKDEDGSLGGFELDTSSTDTAPFEEPGEPSLEEIVGMNPTTIVQVFERKTHMFYAKTPIGLDPVQAPDAYYPQEYINTWIRRSIRALGNSALIFALSLPSLDDVTTTWVAPPATTEQWMQLKYLAVVLENAWQYLAGLVEVGAETPYEEAATFIEDLVEETLYQDVAGLWDNPSSVRVSCSMMYDMSVPGDRRQGVLTGG